MIDAWMYSVVVLGALIAFGGTFLARLSPRLGVPRRWVWLTLMLVSVLGPVAMALRSAPTPHPEPQATLRPEPQARDLQAPCCTTAWGPSPSLRSGSGRGDSILLLGWAAASLLLAGIFALSHRRVRIELTACQRRELLGATVAVSPDFGPAAVGLLRSEVVLPEWVFDLPHDEQRLVLRHELEHIRAGDHFVLLAGVTLAVLMPWNLGLWWQLRRLRVGMEVDCDARVAPTLRDRPRYAALLLRARSQRKVHRLALALVPAPSALAERLMALLESTRLSTRQAVTWSVSALACGVVVTQVPVPNLNPLLATRRPTSAAVTTAPALTAAPAADNTSDVPTRGLGVLPRRASLQRRPRYDSLIPVPVVGAPGHPRYDSLVPYVPGRPTMARGTFTGSLKADSTVRPDSIQEQRKPQ